MDENHVPKDHVPEAAEPDLLESTVEPEAVETRGLRWVIVPALLGVLIGALLGLAQASGPVAPGAVRGSILEAASTGGTLGLIVGGGVWAIDLGAVPVQGTQPARLQTGGTAREDGARGNRRARGIAESYWGTVGRPCPNRLLPPVSHCPGQPASAESSRYRGRGPRAG